MATNSRRSTVVTSLIHAKHNFSTVSRGALGITGDNWIPIPELNRTDADVTLLFLGQSNVFDRTPVLDPWFMATNSISPSSNTTFYVDDGLPHVLGCIEQFQLCIQARTKCTPLTGKDALPDALRAMQMSDVQRNISFILYNEIVSLTMGNILGSHGSSALRVSDTLSDNGIQVSLPNNQWTIEISHWFDIAMARLQQYFVTFAAGPLNSTTDLEFFPGPQNVCGRQKIRNTTGYISFSVLGISIIFSIGGLLIFTSLVLDPIIGYFRKTFGWKDYKRLQWADDEQLELQRLAYSKQVSSEGNTGSSTSEGSAGLRPQTSEGNAGLQADGNTSLQANEGTGNPTSEGNAGIQISEGDADPQTSEGNQANEENALQANEGTGSPTNEGNVGFSISQGN